jgi:hypothetical protein
MRKLMIERDLVDVLDRLRRLEAGKHPLRNVPLSPPLLSLLSQVIRSPGAHPGEIAAVLGVTPLRSVWPYVGWRRTVSWSAGPIRTTAAR